MAFSDEEIAYLQSQPVARLATVNEDGQPDVVPVAFELDGSHIWFGGVGPGVARTRKFRNIGAGRTKVALVVDDLVSIEPFIARALRVYGDAVRDVPVEAVDPWTAEVEHFLSCIEAGAAPTDGSFAQARDALAVALAARASLESGKVEVVPPNGGL